MLVEVDLQDVNLSDVFSRVEKSNEGFLQTVHKGYQIIIKGSRKNLCHLVCTQLLTIGALYNCYLALSLLGTPSGEFSSKGQQNQSIVTAIGASYIMGRQFLSLHESILQVGDFAFKRKNWVEEIQKVYSILKKNQIIAEATRHLSFLRNKISHYTPSLSQVSEDSLRKEAFELEEENIVQITESNVIERMEKSQGGFFSTLKAGFQLSRKIHGLSRVAFRQICVCLGGYIAYRGLASLTFSSEGFSSRGEQTQNTYLMGFITPFFIAKETWKIFHNIWKVGHLEMIRKKSIELLSIDNNCYQQDSFFQRLHQNLLDLHSKTEGIPFQYTSEDSLKKESGWSGPVAVPKIIKYECDQDDWEMSMEYDCDQDDWEATERDGVI